MYEASCKIAPFHLITNNKELFHMYIYIPSGSIYERQGISGISHFLEHMLFKNKGTSANLSKLLTSIGGQYNATTSKDVTCFFVETHVRHYKVVVDILYQITQHITFGRSEFNTEKKVVLEEMAQSSSGSFNMWAMATKSLLTKKNVYNNSVIGTKRSVNGLLYEDVKKYARDRYKTCTIMMNCDKHYKKQALSYVRRMFFPKLPRIPHALQHLETNENWYKKTQEIEQKLVFIRQPIEQFMTCMSFSTQCEASCVHSIGAHFLQYMLTTSGIHSLLNEKIRVKRGLVYTMRSFSDVMRHVGLFYIWFPSNNPNTDYIVNLILDTLHTLKTKGITDKQLAYFKKAYLDTLYVQFTDESYRTEYFGTYAFYGLTFQERDIINYVKAIRNKHIMELSQKCFDFTRMGITSIGKYSDVDTMTKSIENIIMTYDIRGASRSASRGASRSASRTDT
jgi:predicted Zn-dependent peptidase